MSDTGPADLYLIRLAAKTPYRWTIYTVFALTATASLYQRVALGRADQVLPWHGSVLALYGLVMACLARDLRCRTVYFCFGLLVAAAFTRQLLAGWIRWVGTAEIGACLLLVACFARLVPPGDRLRPDDERLGPAEPVLEFDAPKQRTHQEDRDE